MAVVVCVSECVSVRLSRGRGGDMALRWRINTVFRILFISCLLSSVEKVRRLYVQPKIYPFLLKSEPSDRQKLQKRLKIARKSIKYKGLQAFSFGLK